MKELKDISVVYFIGIGGIGMSALARFFHQRGMKVSGYDKTPTQLTNELTQEGISVHYEDNTDLLLKDADLVVYTPAIPVSHKELAFYRQEGYEIMKRSEVLGMITRSLQNICVAGTHGKTTISTMTAHLLRSTGVGCNAFLGGVSANYQTNFWSNPNDICVLEADEFDRSFHKLDPQIAIISSMDSDHLDIYGTAEAMEDAFVQFAQKIRPDGWLIKKFGLDREDQLKAAHTITYHLNNESADVYAKNLKVDHGGYTFDLVINQIKEKQFIVSGLRLNAGGYHNVENSLAAVSASILIGADTEKIKESLSSYKGVRRRFEYVIAPNEKHPVLIDEYAQHPVELKALIEGVRSLFPEYFLLLAFQPHLYTRTRDLADAFAESLDMADAVLLLPIYPARELPIEGVSSQILIDKMNLQQKHLVTRETIFQKTEEYLNKSKKNGDRLVFVTAGAGDIDTLLPKLKDQFIHG
ncbi:MAG: UDP-N-acetylmuramate--L-alanine ligase [Bacteroidota bacterium]